jgi:serine/threonine protein kinase/Flp pilus assembly protein TadD
LIPARGAAVSQTETLQTPIQEPARGTSFAGRYVVIEELGAGGMGKVFRVEDTKIKQEIALKLIKPEIAGDKNIIERFRNELKMARMIAHRNICRTFDLGEAEGDYFITMEYVPGESLKSMIRMSKRLEVGTAVAIGKQVCEGLAEAHRLGVVHRDLKPSNIMIDKDGNVRIMDFGIARSLKEKGITGAGMMIGTPEYMSPEQVEGQDVDQRSDIYSLGIILYEILTGHVPFEGDTPFSVALKQRSEAPRDPRELNGQIPDPLSRAIQKCLAKNRQDRYQTADELRLAMENVEQRLSTSQKAVVKKKSITVGEQPSGPKKPLIYATACTLLILAILGAAYFLAIRRQAKPSVVVLPFTFVEGSPDDRAFGDGLAVTLSDNLLRLERAQGTLWVISPDKVRGADIRTPSQVKQTLGGDYVLTGNIRRNADMIRLTMSLVDAKTLLQRGPPVSFTDPITNLKTWQDDVVIKTVQMLNLKIEPRKKLNWSEGTTSLPSAYESYLRGIGYLLPSEQAETTDEAVDCLQRACEQDPHFPLARIELAMAYRSKYRLTKDPVFLDKARSSGRQALGDNDQLVAADIVLGMTYRDAGQYDPAVQEFRRALQLEPKNYQAYTELGYTYEKAEKLDEAENAYKSALKLRPFYADAYSYLAYFYFIHGRVADAEKMFLKVARLTPGDTWAYSNLGGIYAVKGRYESAEAMFKKSIAIRPNGSALSNLGTIYFSHRRYGDSAAMFEDATKLDEKDYLLWGNLADAYRCVPESAGKAEDAYRRALRLGEEELAKDPNSAQIIARLARFRIILGEQARALEEIDQALKMSPSDVRVLLKSIQVLELAKQRDAAIQSLQRFMDQGGSKEETYSDPDLVGLLKDPRVQQLAKGWKSGT